MPEAELFLMFVRPFNRAGVRYVIAGSVAAIFYGEARLTHDVDFIACLNGNDVQRLPELFPSPDFYVPPLEAINTEIAREQRGHFNIIHANTGFKADVYLTGRDELNVWSFRNKRPIQFKGETVILAPPESVIISKLEYYREGGSQKHVRDIRSMLSVSGDRIDRAVLNEWISRLSLEKEWQFISNY
jgi:hypothetical protein